MDKSLAKRFEFPRMITQWGGYVSAFDKTNVSENVLVRGSQNVYKKLSGNMAVRQGLKRQGVANTIISPISSEFVWYTSFGSTYTMVVSNGTLYVVINKVWYEVQTELSSTRYVFDKWWDNTEKKDRLLFVKGDADLQHWSGGFAQVNGLNDVVTTINTTPVNGGTNYVVGDTITIVGGTGATATITSIRTGGIATELRLITGGSGYGVSASSATTSGSGTGCTVQITAVASPSTSTLILKDVSSTWIQQGFASNTVAEKKFMYGGSEYTYTGGETTNILTGVSPAITITDGDYVIQSVITQSNTPSSSFNADFLKVIGNQVYLGSYSGRQVFMSQDLDFKNYTVPTPQIAGSPGLFVFDGNIKGIGVRQGKACIGYGTSGWAIISFSLVSNNNILTRNNQVDVKPVAILQAPLAHEFISTVGDNLVYLGQDQQVRQFGDFNTAFVSMYPSLSQDVARELQQESFTNGELKCIGEFIYLTAPNSGKTYLRQERTRVDSNGTVVSEKLWHSPFILNASSINQIDGIVVAFSNSNPQIYEVWNTGQWHDDSPSEESIPYTSVMALGYRGEQRRQGLWSFDKQFTEGYADTGTSLYLTINYNYQGYTNVVTKPVTTPSYPAYTFSTNVASIGENSIGDEPMGMGGVTDIANDQDSLPKFKCINSLGLTNVFEWQPIYYSDTVDANWEILACASDAIPEDDQNATFIINKLRN
ncbi:MAG: hypothetical protein WCO06_01525 [Candidatus Roizmanbacteria bacterium]